MKLTSQCWSGDGVVKDCPLGVRGIHCVPGGDVQTFVSVLTSVGSCRVVILIVVVVRSYFSPSRSVRAATSLRRRSRHNFSFSNTSCCSGDKIVGRKYGGMARRVVRCCFCPFVVGVCVCCSGRESVRLCVESFCVMEARLLCML